MKIIEPILAAQWTLPEAALGFVITVLISFLGIAGVASFLRFKEVVEWTSQLNPDETELDKDEWLRLQVALYLGTASKARTEFALIKCHLPSAGEQPYSYSAVEGGLKKSLREADTIIRYDEQTLMILVHLDHDEAVAFIGRLQEEWSICSTLINCAAMRAGIAIYPMHAASGPALIGEAHKAFELCTNEEPFLLGKVEEEEEEEREEEEGETTQPKKKRSREDKILDPVTGVLNDRVLSGFMQRRLSELRLKKEPCVLLCVGVVRHDYILKSFGETGRDELLAAVSEILQEGVRKMDLIGRHEEDGFLILATCKKEQSMYIAQRLSAQVQACNFTLQGRVVRTNLVIGAAGYPEDGLNMHQLYVKAQKVVDYAQKHDIHGYAEYKEQVHGQEPERPTLSVKSAKR